MNVNPGELDKRISIYTVDSGVDSDGYPNVVRVLVHSCWAKFSRVSGTELVKSNADFSDVRVRFLIRYTKTPITRKMVVQYKGADYEISYVNDYEDRHQYMEIWAANVGVEL